MTNAMTGKTHFIPKSIQLHTSGVSNSQRHINPSVTTINAIIPPYEWQLEGAFWGGEKAFLVGSWWHKGTRSPELLILKLQTPTLRFRSDFMGWKCKLQCWITQLLPPKRYWAQILHPPKPNFSKVYIQEHHNKSSSGMQQDQKTTHSLVYQILHN